jgi:hypothetical protein
VSTIAQTLDQQNAALAAAGVAKTFSDTCGRQSHGGEDHAARFAAYLPVVGRVRRVSVLALQRMLGHKSAKVTLDTYADLFDPDLDAVGVTLDSRYSPEVVAKVWPQGVDRHPQQT